jgi:hypothetical protein
MVLRIELPATVEMQYAAEAQAKGLPLEVYLRDRLVAAAPSAPILTPDERVAAFREWVKSHAPHAPLSDEAISRESIYRKRG